MKKVKKIKEAGPWHTAVFCFGFRPYVGPCGLSKVH